MSGSLRDLRDPYLDTHVSVLWPRLIEWLSHCSIYSLHTPYMAITTTEHRSPPALTTTLWGRHCCSCQFTGRRAEVVYAASTQWSRYSAEWSALFHVDTLAETLAACDGENHVMSPELSVGSTKTPCKGKAPRTRLLLCVFATCEGRWIRRAKHRWLSPFHY